MQHAVISGATRGLGRAMTGFFVGQGWVVHGCGRSRDAVDQLRTEFPAPHSFHTVDVVDDTSVAAWASQVLGKNPAPDLLINNAALIARPAPLWELPADAVDPVFDVNLKGTVNLIRHWLPTMIRRGTGVVVNFSSGWGRSTSPEVAVYCATKWGIEGLTSALASELPKGLAAVALNPGVIATDMLRSCWGPGADEYPNPEQWIRAAGPFLLGLSAKDNGRALTVPGG